MIKILFICDGRSFFFAYFSLFSAVLLTIRERFTTFEKCSDMTKKERVESEIFISLYKFRNISFDFGK